MATYKHSSGSKPITSILLLGSLLMVAAIYVNAQYPLMMANLKFKLFGAHSSQSGSSQQDQEMIFQEKINSLIISQRNKNDLREGRPFWGAAAHMVELAFRGAADDITIRREGARMYEFHRFGFGGNREAVVMEYANNALTCVHYPQRQRTTCSPGARSYYSGQPFPFNYEVKVGS